MGTETAWMGLMSKDAVSVAFVVQLGVKLCALFATLFFPSQTLGKS